MYTHVHCNVQIVSAVAVFNKRLPLPEPEAVPLEMAMLPGLISVCWEHDPARRPSFEDVVKRLRQASA